jgi:hypothetical protein
VGRRGVGELSLLFRAATMACFILFQYINLKWLRPFICLQLLVEIIESACFLGIGRMNSLRILDHDVNVFVRSDMSRPSL